MDNTDSKLVRPGDPRVPCFAILGCKTSKLKLVNLEGGSSSSVKISDDRSLGIVTINSEVYAVTEEEILKLRSDGTTEPLPPPLLNVSVFSRVVLFQKKIYIIQPDRRSMLCFDPADNSLTDDLPGCGLGQGFCASATDDFIYAMGGCGTETRAVKYDPLKLKWKNRARMRRKRRDAAAATLDGKIYVMGGDDHHTSVEYYNPGNNSWTEISNMNADRSLRSFSACVVGDQLYAVGGDGVKNKGFWQQSIEVYDKNKWTVTTKFQTKNGWTSSCFWPHGLHQPGGVLTEVKASVGQLATGNVDVTEKNTGSNYVAERPSDGSVTHITYNITANQVAIGDGAKIFGNRNISGDVSTVINAPVGQVATGNANITEQGTGNNHVAGSLENTDRSITAENPIYGQSTSSSVGENITVHRTGK